MIPRQKELFKNIVEEYIKTSQPVGSKLVVDKFHPDISSATVRNDMAELEEQGLINQPHTSAGRVPTEDGFRKYVAENVDQQKFLNKKEAEEIRKNITGNTDREIKELAKNVAAKSKASVFVAFDSNDVYYTGLSNLFSQPEFRNFDLICNLSQVIDHLAEVIEKIYDQVGDLEIKIGSQNPFSSDCSMVAAKNKNILIGILGPMRMNYQYNVQLINFVREII